LQLLGSFEGKTVEEIAEAPLLSGIFWSRRPPLGIIALICFHQPPHKALPRSALLEKHPVRRVGGAEGDSRPRNPPLKIPLMRL
jgi:hypothetical protein